MAAVINYVELTNSGSNYTGDVDLTKLANDGDACVVLYSEVPYNYSMDEEVDPTTIPQSFMPGILYGTIDFSDSTNVIVQSIVGARAKLYIYDYGYPNKKTMKPSIIYNGCMFSSYDISEFTLIYNEKGVIKMIDNLIDLQVLHQSNYTQPSSPDR